MTTRPRVVIVGAGFGGFAAARELRNAAVEITVVDRRNHHLFQPLLYQVATAGLSPADIAAPIRSLLAGQPNVTVVLGEVTGIDTAAKTLEIDNGVRESALHYDYLILATGAGHAYFGHDEWAPVAPGLKTVEDATLIRHRLLMAFELAEMTPSAEERDRLLTIAIIGGGPTGVEMAGAIAELAKAALARDFRHIDPRRANVLLIEAGPRVLSTFPDDLSTYAEKALKRLGVQVMTGARVTLCDENGVVLGDRRIPAGTIIWGAGVKASPVTALLDAPRDRAGRVQVAPDFSLPSHPEIFVVGDAASLTDAGGRPVPGVAPAAKQGGRHAAKVVRARIEGVTAPAPFRYRNFGNLATIGRRAAVIDFGRIHLRGAIAWWLWGFAHIFFLVNFRNRVSVTLNWLWSFLTFKRGARLITGPSEPARTAGEG